jgi:pimeloyl-ACP methyl ester carboxylesterase
MVSGVRHRDIHANGVRVHVAESGNGRPVVLLHGFPQHWYAWRFVIDRLSDDHQLWAFDQRGFGWSSTPPRGYDLETRIRDLLGLLDALDLDEVDLISHQWGAWTGFFACLEAPERFRHHLALLSSHETLDEYCAVLQRPGVARSGELLHGSFIAHDIPALLLVSRKVEAL